MESSAYTPLPPYRVITYDRNAPIIAKIDGPKTSLFASYGVIAYGKFVWFNNFEYFVHVLHN